MCKICGQSSPEFVKINNTDQYSDIEISVSKVGLLRARNFKGAVNPTNFSSKPAFNQDVVNIKFCPLCGKMFNQTRNNNTNS